MYKVGKEIASDRKQRTKDNRGRTTDYGKRYKRILEKRAETVARAAMPHSVRRSAKRQGSL